MEQINNALVLSEKKLKELNRISNSKLLRGKAMFNTKVYSILSNFRTKDKCKENNVANKSEIKNVGLHGSAIIFSKDYYKKYEHVFFPGTFLYLEEDILFYRVLQDKLISVYYPKTYIFFIKKIVQQKQVSIKTLINMYSKKKIYKLLKNIL